MDRLIALERLLESHSNGDGQCATLPLQDAGFDRYATPSPVLVLSHLVETAADDAL